jgi:sarcosine oxidase
MKIGGTPNGYDVIVVGLGSMGSSACYHLAGRGARVLGLEQFDIPHPNGSGHGFSRMIRTAYHEHPDYVPLLRSAFALWHQLETEFGQKLIYITGGLYMGSPEDGLPAATMVAARKYGVPFELLDRTALRRRFPQFHVPEHFVGMLEQNAGFVVPEKAIAAHALLALRRGAELHGREPVTSWSADDSCVKVVTGRGTYRAGQVLFCGGAWTDKLVRDLGVPLRVTRQVLGWVWPKKTDPFELGRLPVWAFDAGDGGQFYGFPMMPDNPGFKLARHFPGSTVDPDTVLRVPTDGDEETFRPALRQIPEADGHLLSLRVCLYTYSPDSHFIIDRHPQHSRVTLACGFSGHGFKFASVVGQALADLATKGGTEHPIGFLGLSRFKTA